MSKDLYFEIRQQEIIEFPDREQYRQLEIQKEYQQLKLDKNGGNSKVNRKRRKL